jgi:hydroxymethylpyrimidine pyrophosphatase-like HAD family hydrolase
MMRYLVLITDYDGTLAKDGRVPEASIAAMTRLRSSGRRMILVTGRRMDDLAAVCRCLDCFDFVVAENGGVLYELATRGVTPLAKPPPSRLISRLRAIAVEPLEVGEAILATRVPHENAVTEVLRELGLECQVTFNRGAVMILPSGVNKASGVKHALRRLGLSPHEAVGIGDAENDHSFLDLCECAVAVADAIESIKEIAAFVTSRGNGEGVVEVIDGLIADDLEHVDAKLTHHHIALGTRLDGTTVWVPPYGRNILVAGPSGSGKSTFATGLIERLADQLYQVCIIDPEGDYVNLPNIVTIGDRHAAPSVDEVLAVLRDPDVHVNVNLLGIALLDRPSYFAELLPRLQTMRGRTGRPHWLVIDEAHHLLPSTWGPAPRGLPQQLGETVLVTVHPGQLPSPILSFIDVVVAVGPRPNQTMQEFTASAARPAMDLGPYSTKGGDVVCWLAHGGQDPFPMSAIRGQAERIRHVRKYAEGDVRYHSFYFRGPHGKHNLKAQNLSIFCQIADGIDSETWLFHLRRGDYSRWLRDVIKNEEVARDVQKIESRSDLAAAETRTLVRQAIESRYTLPE